MEILKARTDEQLVSLYVSGNNEAFDVLLERYKDRLYSYILYSIQNPDMADDLFQETFVKAIMHIRNGKYVETGKFYPWLTRIAHNLIIDQFRTERCENLISNDEVEKDIYDCAAQCDDCLEKELATEQTFNNIRKLIKDLPESQRTVVEMHYYKYLSFKEISDQTGVSINTALGRMRYALMNMRRMASENNMNLYLG